jgi:methionyl-tRNA formyltransferase
MVAGYGLPAEFGLMTLFGLGLRPDQISVLTHASDDRNAGLLGACSIRRLQTCTTAARSPNSLEFVRTFHPDLILSLHYRELIPTNILDVPKFGGLNLHPSLLPRYRGTNSVQWMIINGEQTTGFTYHRMDASFDNGPIILQREFEVKAFDTAFSLFHRQICEAMCDLKRALELVLDGYEGVPQKGEASYFARSLPFEGVIQPDWNLTQVERFVRAMYFPPFAPAEYIVRGVRVAVPDVETFKRLRH